MPRGKPSRLEIARGDISRFFEDSAQRVYWPGEIAHLLGENRGKWRLAANTTSADFVRFMLKRTALHEVRLIPVNHPQMRPVMRYCWGDISRYQIGLSLKRDAFLSHGTAAFLHALTDQLLTIIYVNQEQSEKPRPSGALSQEGLDRAFSGHQRRSNLLLEYNNHDSCSLAERTPADWKWDRSR